MKSTGLIPDDAVVERICAAEVFLAAPKACQLLRGLDRLTRESDLAIRTADVAERILGLRNPRAPDLIRAAVRAQALRLRKLLAEYYGGQGADDSVRVRLPRGNYRLVFERHDAAAAEAERRQCDHVTIMILEFANHGLDARQAWATDALLHQLAVEFGRCSATTVIAPVSRTVLSRSGLDSTAVGGGYPESFLIDGALQPVATGLRLVIRLLDGRTGRQVWSGDLVIAAGQDGGHLVDREAVRRLAEHLGDEVGVITCEILRHSAARPAASLSPHEAILSLWRYYLSALPTDLERARLAITAVSDRVSHLGLVEAMRAFIELEVYFASVNPRERLGQGVFARLQRARSLSPGLPWVDLVYGHALWAARRTAELPHLLGVLEAKPATAFFGGMLGCLRILARIEAERGRELIDEAERISPQGFWWWPVHRAFHCVLQDDWAAADRALANVVGKPDVYSLALRVAVAVRLGDAPAARMLAETLVEECPEFPRAGEVILRRLLHDDYVDRIAAAFESLGLTYFG